MKRFLPLVVASLLCLASCSKTDNNEFQPNIISTVASAHPDLNGTPGLAKQIIDENRFIDLDLISLNSKITEASTSSRNIEDTLCDDISMAKAAIYRFYSQVSAGVEGYELAPCTATELNISEGLFNTLKNNLDEMNTFYKEACDKGETVEIAPITQDYLDSLLK